MRLQTAYDPSMLPGISRLQRLEMRRDARFQAGQKSVTLSLRACTLPKPLAQLGAGFQGNLGADLVAVFGPKVLSLPGASQLGGQAEWPVDIPFAQTFRYDPRSGPLLFDYQVSRSEAGSYRLDASGVCTAPLQYYGPAGCARAPGAAPLRLLARTQNLMWGNELVLAVENAVPGKLAMIFFGLQGSGVWRGVPLPFDAGIIGARGCHLSTSVLYAPRRPADTLGEAEFGWVVPALPQLQGVRVSAQAIAEAPQANPLGAISSQAAWLTICGAERVGRVFANDLHSLSGVRQLGVAPVIRLTSQ